MIKTLLFVFSFLPIVVFAQLDLKSYPKENQLYPRDDQNKALVEFSGKVTIDGYERITLVVKENENVSVLKSSELVVNREFSFSHYIHAGRTLYSFDAYLVKSSGDSSLVFSVKDIVCGDFYILYGQSNIKAQSGVDELERRIDTRFLRNFDFDLHNPNQTKWYKAIEPYTAVGVMGLTLQSMILDTYGIPTCIINGGVGGADIHFLTAKGSEKERSSYGNLYKRVREAGALNNIKAIVWRQGEAETCSWGPDILNYGQRFRKLYEQLSNDFPGFVKFYNIQTSILSCNKLEEAGLLREYMRQTRYLFDKVETLNAHNLPLVDDVHFGLEGYTQTVKELFPLIARDIYGSIDVSQIHAPDIQKVISKGDSLILVFEEDQKIVYPQPFESGGVYWKMEDYIYVNSHTNSNNHLIETARADRNRVYLKLKESVREGFVTYLPSYTNFSPPVHPIHLTNGRGVRAMSFYKLPIVKALETPVISASRNTENRYVELNLQIKDNYIIERSIKDKESFKSIGILHSQDRFIDSLIANVDEEIYYRVKRVSASSESDYSNLVEIKAKLSLEPNVIDRLLLQEGTRFKLYGSGFTKDQKVYINGRLINLTFVSDTLVEFSYSEFFDYYNTPSGVQEYKVSTLIDGQEFSTTLKVLPTPWIWSISAISLEVDSVEGPSFSLWGINLDLDYEVILKKGDVDVKADSINVIDSKSIKAYFPVNMEEGRYDLSLSFNDRKYYTRMVFNVRKVLSDISITPSRISYPYSEVISIRGDFPSGEPSIYLEPHSFPNPETISWSDSLITFKLKGDAPPGEYDVRVRFEGQRYYVYRQKITLELVLSNEEREIATAFPNPLGDSDVFVQFPEKIIHARWILKDGKTQNADFREVENAKYSVSTDKLSTGLSILEVNSANRREVFKILKK